VIEYSMILEEHDGGFWAWNVAVLWINLLILENGSQKEGINCVLLYY
jgi:hypothetical protein